ncbi:glycosyltransferase family 1 protein [Sphingomonas aracearum]|uniref:Glycosyltransferase family 1 protein n=1 Tax=Sphingomonas aracearum TaxID=2283317 RepID=A0A369VXJ8_9SPHN|nr:glycosyltransferase family 1 protein [Sphingomonas aracearum]
MAVDRYHLVINGRFLTQPTTGVQRVARELTREIDRMVARGEVDMRVRLVCEQLADFTDMELEAVEVERVGASSGHLWEQTVLPRHVGDARLLCMGNTAPIASLLGGVPVALMMHDLSYRLFPDAYTRRYRLGHSLLMPLLLRRSDPIFTVSATEKAMLSSLVPASRSRIVVAQNGGWRDDHVARFATDSARRREYALYVGSFSRRKNFDGVLATAIRLAREDGLPTLLVGASGHFLAPPDGIIPSDVAPLIRMVGQVEDIDVLARLYLDAACLIFPSFYEASPLPPVEAMSLGCPVVASGIPSLRERCGEAAAYCDPHDPEDMLRAVRRVVHDEAFRAQLVADGYRRAARYSWREQARVIVHALLNQDRGGVVQK